LDKRKIKGIYIGKEEVILSLLSDDMIINVEDSKYSITTKCPLRTNKCIQ
jgi:hypothetical protein